MNDEEIKEWNKQILKELEEIDYDDYEIDYIGDLIVNEKHKVIIIKGDKSEENINIPNNNFNNT